MNARRGFTLIEVVVALVLATLVGGLVHRVLLRSQRLSGAQAERMALQDNVRTAALILAGELSPLGFDEITPEAAAALGMPPRRGSDLISTAEGAVRYLGGRGGGYLCAVVAGAPGRIVAAAVTWRSFRAPRAGDSLLVFAESDSATASDDAWLHLGVAAAGRDACPDGRDGLAIEVGLPPYAAPVVLDRVVAGAPVRLAETMEMRYYRSERGWWLGMRSVATGEVITPVAGPLADSTAGSRGLTLRYRGGSDEPVADPAVVRAIEVSLVGVTDRPVYGRSALRPLVDSLALSTRVALRNAPGR